ncbi:MAG: 4Fe-4S binding protein [Nitrospirae bacterium]|jgi:NAD-dependent dihydropyrimidine dehydrogenase PreA subunit|nr:4Fe-4S binding protein [Nitrospirota bacterium]
MEEVKRLEEKEKKLDDIRRESENKKCPVQRLLYYIDEFISGPMCSKCFPCSLGTAEARIRLRRISKHTETDIKDIEVLERIGAMMIEGSFCKKGKDTGKFIIDLINSSKEEFQNHIYGICSSTECIALIEYIIDPELCTMCGKCLEVCKEKAILGEKKKPFQTGYLPFEIRKKRCTRCGECIKVCPEGAIKINILKPEFA